MTHLKIENQNSNVEIVNNAIILKLYDLALDIEENLEEGESLSDYVSLKGNLLADHAYQNALTYLNNKTKFPNLLVNVPVGAEYVDFKNPDTEKKLLTLLNLTDGFTPGYIASITNFGDIFRSSDIEDFEDLALFLNVTTAPYYLFYLNTKLKRVDLKNIVILGVYNLGGGDHRAPFGGVTSLEYIGDVSKIKELGTYAFENTALAYDVLYFQSVEKVGIDPFGGTQMTGKNVVYGLNLTYLSSEFYKPANYIILASTPPQFGNPTNLNRYNVPIYVPDKTVYQQDSNWASVNHLYNISELDSYNKLLLIDNDVPIQQYL